MICMQRNPPSRPELISQVVHLALEAFPKRRNLVRENEDLSKLLGVPSKETASIGRGHLIPRYAKDEQR